jgi:hypothetical protein
VSYIIDLRGCKFLRRLKIAIDQQLKRNYGPEIYWTWRVLLSGCGFCWEEVPMGSSECDIAYGTERRHAGRCQLFVRAKLAHWEQKSNFRLNAVGQGKGGAYPIYEGESRGNEWFHIANGCLVCERDLIFDVFWLATGQEERYWPKNKHGHFELGKTAGHHKEALCLALASQIAWILQNTLTELKVSAPIPRWPHGKRAAACVGHDVDYPEVVRWLEPLRILRRQGLTGLSAAASVLRGKRNHWHFASWVRMEQSLKARSAFYFVPRRGSLLEYATGTPNPFYDVQSHRFKKLFKYLADEGFEIGLHASYCAFESREKFAAEKQTLEYASGQTIHGNRHHYWRLKPDDPESTLLIHEQIGLKYDMSLTHERYVGWRRGLSWPFFPLHQKERRELRTLQIPTAWMDDHLFGYQKDNPGDRFDVLRALADNAAEQGGCLNIDVHDYVFDDLLFPGWAKTYQDLWEYITSRSDFWVATPGRIADHWIERYSSIIQSSQGLSL